MTALLVARWLTANAVPFSVLGIALVVAGLHFDQQRTRQSRLVFGCLVAMLVATVLVTTGYAAEVYDICSQYSGTWWYWVWGCYL